MTGRERVKAALTFSGPDRVPRDLWSVSYIPLFRQDELDAVRARFPMDIERPEPAPGVWSHAADHLRKAGSYTDEWGVGWQVGEPGIVGEVKNPPLADWSKLSSFRPPVHLHHDIDWDYVNRQCDASDRFMLSDECALTFERLQFLRGTEALLMDIAYGAKELTRLIEMVHSFYLESVTRWSKSDVDGVFLSDDWGSNTALLIDPSTWRSLFKPLYRQYCSIIRANGKFAFFHSDGNISAIYDDLVEVGFHAVNSQLFCMDMAELASKYRGHITFWGEIDGQFVLPFGTTNDVRNAVMQVREALDNGSGGVVAQCTWGKDCSRENIETVFNAWNDDMATREG